MVQAFAFCVKGRVYFMTTRVLQPITRMALSQGLCLCSLAGFTLDAKLWVTGISARLESWVGPRGWKGLDQVHKVVLQVTQARQGPDAGGGQPVTMSAVLPLPSTMSPWLRGVSGHETSKWPASPPPLGLRSPPQAAV